MGPRSGASNKPLAYLAAYFFAYAGQPTFDRRFCWASTPRTNRDLCDPSARRGDGLRSQPQEKAHDDQRVVSRYFAPSPRRMSDGNAVPRPQGAKVANALRLLSGLVEQGCSNPSLQFLHGTGPKRDVCSLNVYHFLFVRGEQLLSLRIVRELLSGKVVPLAAGA